MKPISVAGGEYDRTTDRHASSHVALSNRASRHIGWTAARCLRRTNVTRSRGASAPKSAVQVKLVL